MCWSMGATAAMVAGGAIATLVTIRRGEPVAIPVTLAYFTLMEGLQLAGYATIDQCGTPANQTVTLLSILHIVFQPLLINAFAMELVRPRPGTAMRVAVFTLAALSSVVMLLQLYPFPWAGACRDGSNLCGAPLCTVAGDWHLAWQVPYNGLLNGIDGFLGNGFGFPTYMVATFVLPLFYGAWRFALFHLVAGPLLAGQLTGNPDEVPAIWCLFSIGIIVIALSPPVRRVFSGDRGAAGA